MAETALTDKVESFVKEQLADARAQLRVVESEAGKVATKAEKAAGRAVKSVRAKAKKGEREVRVLLKSARIKQLETAVNHARTTVFQWLQSVQTLPSHAVGAFGIATSSEVQDLARQVAKLTKRVDALTKTKKNGNA